MIMRVRLMMYSRAKISPNKTMSSKLRSERDRKDDQLDGEPGE
jgi:hypothetical protein